MTTPFRTQRRIEFHQTDCAGIVHFSAFFLMMEEAEHAYLRHLELGVHLNDEKGAISWPRVSATCDFRNALRFQDEIEIEVFIAERGASSVSYGFHFLKADKLMAEGRMTSVCCRMGDNGPSHAIRIPDWIAEKLPAPDNSPS
jgi:acyl-CoA thioester hydrolase